ncbi:thiol:disulfide interchange protein DsbA/DsbL [Vibrio sp. SCSIO 43136]|uniref:thiol:disulfide interchange protein DsbA/DsbL n=1 Tax=Vibrio sp. SCSIO 43136 TaxID=2819101 RepID=UPI0020750559|nr:thiol:disulfide interchange protein DsbA/DsbL [Vibrio sp. SCSIO 43136]USD67959.1 thiol:disulfide interchange protein DsbA/DsbL [Vibrio sp. SCSIO 43136]
MIIKKLSLATLVLSSLALIGCSDTAEPKLGEQYKLLPTELKQNSITPVTEVFSLTCGHCRSMEKVIPQIEEGINKPIGKVHITFNESAQVAALIYYAAQMQLDSTPDHEMMEKLFSVMQSQDYTTGEARQQALESLFNEYGLVSPYQFDEIQQKALFELLNEADEITQQSQINGVPTFIIKGKYELITSGHEDVNDLVKTINYLLSKTSQ